MTNEVPRPAKVEDMNTLLGVLIDVQNQMILHIAGEIASTNTTIRDLDIEFAERMQMSTYSADDMIDTLDAWKPDSRQRIHDVLAMALDNYHQNVTETPSQDEV